jgi:hypothetical protein
VAGEQEDRNSHPERLVPIQDLSLRVWLKKGAA